MKRFLLIFLGLFLLFCVITAYSFITTYDGKLHVIICNVGQGDAALIRTPDAKYILIDGGPDDTVLSCLSNNMPLWERRIDLVLLSHPHFDHFIGLIPVIKRYTAKYFVTERLGNSNAAFRAFEETLIQEKVVKHYVASGDSFAIGKKIQLRIISPTKELIFKTSPEGNIADSKEFTNLIHEVTYGDVSFLFTGDSQAPILSMTAGSSLQGKIRVLQVPHHGSRFGLSDEIITSLRPDVAYVSVGKNNYGHPAPVTLELLQTAKIPILRTDRNGTIEFITDGKTLTYKTER